MKHLLLTTIAAVLLVGCGESQQSTPTPETKPVEPVAEVPTLPSSSPPEVELAWLLDNSVQAGNIQVVKHNIAIGADVNAKNEDGETPLDWAIEGEDPEIADLLRKHGGKTAEELKAEGK